MKTTILFFCWAILALAAAKAVKNNCEHDGCESLSYDELLKYFEDDNFTAISDEISQQLDGEMPTEEKWIDIINTLRNGKQPEYLNLGEQHLLFSQNQTGYLNFSTGIKSDFNRTFYGKMERNGRMGSYSSLSINLMNTTGPSANEISTAIGIYGRVYFSLAEDTVTWQGIGKALPFNSYPNGTFYKILNQFSAMKGKAERKKGKAERKKGNTIVVTTTALDYGEVKILRSSNFSLDFAEGRPNNLYGTSETFYIDLDMNMTLSLRGDYPREGKGKFHILSFGNAISNRLPFPIDIESRDKGYSSFDSSQPFSNKNLPTFFDSLF